MKRKTQALYDHASRLQSGQHRDESTTIVLKKFHNLIKSLLYEEFAKRKRILDLASGRGGDIWKYRHAHVQQVVGIDLSPQSITEARKRLQAMKNDTLVDVQFECVSDFATTPYTTDFAPFDAVSCMFALHYFFESEDMLHMTIGNISNNLQKGGVFFGCLPHGLKVLELLNHRSEHKSDVLLIKRDTEQSPACFGSSYTLSIADTVVESASEEFLVFENVLTTVCAMHGLQPITGAFQSEQLNRLLSRGEGRVFKHFLPRFQSEKDQEEISKIFCAFAFIKN